MKIASFLQCGVSWIALVGCLNIGSAAEKDDIDHAAHNDTSAFTPGLNPPISAGARAAKQESIIAKLNDIEIRLARITNQRKAVNEEFFVAWRERQEKYQTYKGRIWGQVRLTLAGC